MRHVFSSCMESCQSTSVSMTLKWSSRLSMMRTPSSSISMMWRISSCECAQCVQSWLATGILQRHQQHSSCQPALLCGWYFASRGQDPDIAMPSRSWQGPRDVPCTASLRLTCGHGMCRAHACHMCSRHCQCCCTELSQRTLEWPICIHTPLVQCSYSLGPAATAVGRNWGVGVWLHAIEVCCLHIVLMREGGWCMPLNLTLVSLLQKSSLAV